MAKRSFIASCLCMVGFVGVVQAEPIVFPPDAVVDITKAPYYATPNDETDDTAAFRQALLDKRNLIYIPDGTYIVSDTLAWGDRQTRQVLQGQSEAGTIIILADGTSAFADPAKPKAVIWTGKAPAQRFRNGIRNLTVHTGDDNPGAIGIQYMANNQGAMRNVTIRHGNAAGPIGLDLGYSNENGPCLINNVTVVGFDVGISIRTAVNSITLDGITLRDQRRFGIVNDGQCVTLRGLDFTGSVTAYYNKAGPSLTSMSDSTLRAEPSSDAAAILNEAALFARNVRTQGFARAIDNSAGTGSGAPAGDVQEFVSHAVLSLYPTQLTSLNLPAEPMPQVPWHPMNEWVSLTQFEPKKVELTRDDGKTFEFTDWAPALQQAIDSGARTIYMPGGERFRFLSPVTVRGNVERIIGLDYEMGRNVDQHRMKLRIEGDGPPLVIEHFDFTYSRVQFTHAGRRPLILRSLSARDIIVERDAGPLFIDDVVVDTLHLHPGTRVFARQLNMEKFGHDDGVPMVINDAGTLRVLGFKTENDPDLMHLKPGSSTEVLGGFIYANKNFRTTDQKRWFVVDEGARLSFTLGEWVGRKQPFTPVVLTRQGQTLTLRYGQAYRRGEGSLVPLFVAK